MPEAIRQELPRLGIATYDGLADGRFAEAYHKVRSTLEFAFLENEVRTILITSPNASEGKTTTASNLALAFASVGRRTVLIDADFRRPRQHEIYGIEQTPGLSDVVLEDVDLIATARPVAGAGLETLRIIPAGADSARPGGVRGYRWLPSDGPPHPGQGRPW